ncbi:MAG: hypothetical protein HHAS10_08600 [Candidatus Altimarinota bacterium]
MKTLLRKDIPEDFVYYRTGSIVFFEYLKQFRTYIVQKVHKRGDFFSATQIFPGFWSITAEKIDTELSKVILKKYRIFHGIIWWTPMRRIAKPKGWLGMPTWWVKRDIHSSRSAFSILDQVNYWEKWSSKARAHRRKVLEHIENGSFRIRKDVTLDEFLFHYKETPVHDGDKDFRLRLTKKLFHNTKTDYRIYVVEKEGKILAGALFIDMGTTSEYWVSFYHRDGYPLHLGIAIMDIWFLDSYEKGIKYCDLDHMRDTWQSWGYKGYTKFKEAIADYDTYFHDMWIKIF